MLGRGRGRGNGAESARPCHCHRPLTSRPPVPCVSPQLSRVTDTALSHRQGTARVAMAMLPVYSSSASCACWVAEGHSWGRGGADEGGGTRRNMD